MLIIDTEMPTCCEDCFAQQEYYNPRWDETEYSCGINGKKLGTHCRQDWGEWHCDKPEWCPLKEVKNDECTKIMWNEIIHPDMKAIEKRDAFLSDDNGKKLREMIDQIHLIEDILGENNDKC